jgi:hypothetical protein
VFELRSIHGWQEVRRNPVAGDGRYATTRLRPGSASTLHPNAVARQSEASGEPGKRRVITLSDGRHLLHLRFALPPGQDPDVLQQLRRLLEDFTPRVQMLEPDSAVADLTGAIRFWHLLWGFRICGVTSRSALR